SREERLLPLERRARVDVREVGRDVRDPRGLRRRTRAGETPQGALGNPGGVAGGGLHLREARGVLENGHAVAHDRLVVHGGRLVGSDVEVLDGRDDDGGGRGERSFEREEQGGRGERANGGAGPGPLSVAHPAILTP